MIASMIKSSHFDLRYMQQTKKQTAFFTTTVLAEYVQVVQKVKSQITILLTDIFERSM